jgi:hypothetical protein
MIPAFDVLASLFLANLRGTMKNVTDDTVIFHTQMIAGGAR